MQLVAGWTIGYFGLFGLKKQEVNVPGLNFAGVALCIAALIVFSAVKPGMCSPLRLV
jgi:uncharacterized membrane protein YdcZ (DUF606 family)